MSASPQHPPSPSFSDPPIPPPLNGHVFSAVAPSPSATFSASSSPQAPDALGPPSPLLSVPQPHRLCAQSAFQTYPVNQLQVCYFPKSPNVMTLPLLNAHYESQVWSTSGRTKLYSTFVNHSSDSLEAALMIPSSLGTLCAASVRVMNIPCDRNRNLALSTPATPVRAYQSTVIPEEDFLRMKANMKDPSKKNGGPDEQKMDGDREKLTGILGFLARRPHESCVHLSIPHIDTQESIMVELEFLIETKFNTLTRQYNLTLPTSYPAPMLCQLAANCAIGGPGRQIAQDVQQLISYSVHINTATITPGQQIVTPFRVESKTHQLGVQLLQQPQQGQQQQQTQVDIFHQQAAPLSPASPSFGSGTYQTYHINISNAMIRKDEQSNMIESAPLEINYILPLTNQIQTLALREIDLPEFDWTTHQPKDMRVERGAFMLQFIPPAIEACFMSPPGTVVPIQPTTPRDIQIDANGGPPIAHLIGTPSAPTPVGSAFAPCVLPRTCIFVVDVSGAQVDQVQLQGLATALSCFDAARGDFVQVILFSDTITQFAQTLTPATPDTRNNITAFLHNHPRKEDSFKKALGKAVEKAFECVREAATSANQQLVVTQPLIYLSMREDDRLILEIDDTPEDEAAKRKKSDKDVNIAQLQQDIQLHLDSIRQDFSQGGRLPPRPRFLTQSSGASVIHQSFLQHLSNLTGGGTTVHTVKGGGWLTAQERSDATTVKVQQQMELYGGVSNRPGVLHTTPCLHHMQIQISLEDANTNLPIDLSLQMQTLTSNEAQDQTHLQLYPSDSTIPDLTFGQVVTVVGTYITDSRRNQIRFPRWIRIKAVLPNGLLYDQRVEVFQDFTVPVQRLCSTRIIEHRSTHYLGTYGKSAGKKDGKMSEDEAYHRKILSYFSLRSGIETPITRTILTEVATAQLVQSDEEREKERKYRKFVQEQRQKQYDAYLAQQQTYHPQQMIVQQQYQQQQQVVVVQSGEPQQVIIVKPAPPQPLYYSSPQTTSSRSYYSIRANSVENLSQYDSIDLMLDLLFWNNPQAGAYGMGGYGGESPIDVIFWPVTTPLYAIHAVVSLLNNATGGGSGGRGDCCCICCCSTGNPFQCCHDIWNCCFWQDQCCLCHCIGDGGCCEVLHCIGSCFCKCCLLVTCILKCVTCECDGKECEELCS